MWASFGMADILDILGIEECMLFLVMFSMPWTFSRLFHLAKFASIWGKTHKIGTLSCCKPAQVSLNCEFLLTLLLDLFPQLWITFSLTLNINVQERVFPPGCRGKALTSATLLSAESCTWTALTKNIHKSLLGTKHLPGLSLGKREGRRKSCTFWGGDDPPVGGNLGSAYCSVSSQYHSPNPAVPLLFPLPCGCAGGSEPFLECWQASETFPLPERSCAVSLETRRRNALPGAARRREGMETVALGFFSSPPSSLPFQSNINMSATYSKQERQGGNGAGCWNSPTNVTWAETGHEWPHLCGLESK